MELRFLISFGKFLTNYDYDYDSDRLKMKPMLLCVPYVRCPMHRKLCQAMPSCWRRGLLQTTDSWADSGRCSWCCRCRGCSLPSDASEAGKTISSNEKHWGLNLSLPPCGEKECQRCSTLNGLIWDCLKAGAVLNVPQSQYFHIHVVFSSTGSSSFRKQEWSQPVSSWGQGMPSPKLSGGLLNIRCQHCKCGDMPAPLLQMGRFNAAMHCVCHHSLILS